MVTNSRGTPIVGVSPEILNGVYGTDDTNYNVATFDNLAVSTTVGISSVPNLATSQSTATPSIPFVVNSSSGNTVTVTAQTGNTNLTFF